MSGGGMYKSGGSSSLDYLFGSGGEKQAEVSSAPTPTVSGGASNDNKRSISRKPPKSPSKKTDVTNNYQRAQGKNLGNFITGRPTTKVKSPPGGGESSIGYLFADK